MAVETPTAQILGFLGCCVIGVHDWERRVGAHEGAGVLHGAGRVGAEKGGLCGDDYGGRIVAVHRVKLVNRRMGRGRGRR